MRWVKNKYELTIRDVSMLFETEDPALLSRFRWIPAFILVRFYAKFMLDFAEMFNSREVNGLINEDIYRFRLTIKANNILYPLYIGLMLDGQNEDFRKIYRDVIGRDFNGAEDLKIIIKEMERLKSKIAEAGTPLDRLEKSDKISFEALVANTEMLLERSLPRDMKLYEFKKQYDLAIARARELERIRENSKK